MEDRSNRSKKADIADGLRENAVHRQESVQSNLKNHLNPHFLFKLRHNQFQFRLD
jgi:hypothetical protein